MNGHGHGCKFFHWVMALLSVSWNRLYTKSITQGERDVYDAKKDTNLSFLVSIDKAGEHSSSYNKST